MTSGENRDQFYHHGFSFQEEELLSILSQRPGGADLGFDPASPPFMMGLSDYMTSTAAGGGDGAAAMVAPVTPNFSVSSSSTEVGGEEDSDLRMKQDQEQLEEEKEAKGSEEGPADNFKKANKPRKKGEKRQKEPRFAFVCKSEVDHLEDGYRWRKYGQKAVKNSPYPRSYYRCTAQKCNVKKRVERSHQDPSTVITTYEGQHHHYSPASIRSGVGCVGGHLFSPPSPMAIPGSNFDNHAGGFQLLHQVMPSPPAGNPSLYNFSGGLPPPPLPAQRLQLPAADFGLLQDVLPSFSHGGQQ